MSRWRCKECGELYPDEAAIPKWPGPGEANLWSYCPRCNAPEQFVELCDEPGCDRPAGCGFLTPAGYRRTCGPHYRAALEKR